MREPLYVSATNPFVKLFFKKSKENAIVRICKKEEI